MACKSESSHTLSCFGLHNGRSFDIIGFGGLSARLKDCVVLFLRVFGGF